MDKITHIYAGGDEGVKNFRNDFPYSDAKKDPVKGAEYSEKYKDFEFYQYTNIDKFDSKFWAWSKFVNHLWEGKQKKMHLNIRSEILKAVCMKETGMGTGEKYNGTVNIMHSMTIGDGTFWHMANENPYSATFFELNSKNTSITEKNVLAWLQSGKITNGYVQFKQGDAFGENLARLI